MTNRRHHTNGLWLIRLTLAIGAWINQGLLTILVHICGFRLSFVRVHFYLHLLCGHTRMKSIRPAQLILEDSHRLQSQSELAMQLSPEQNAQDPKNLQTEITALHSASTTKQDTLPHEPQKRWISSNSVAPLDARKSILPQPGWRIEWGTYTPKTSTEQESKRCSGAAVDREMKGNRKFWSHRK